MGAYCKERHERYIRFIRLSCLAVTVLAVLIGFMGCKAKSSADSPGNRSDVLQEPPSMKLSDVLSGTMEEFEVTSGNYTWNYPNGDEMTGGLPAAPIRWLKQRTRSAWRFLGITDRTQLVILFPLQ